MNLNFLTDNKSLADVPLVPPSLVVLQTCSMVFNAACRTPCCRRLCIDEGRQFQLVLLRPVKCRFWVWQLKLTLDEVSMAECTALNKAVQQFHCPKEISGISLRVVVVSNRIFIKFIDDSPISTMTEAVCGQRGRI